MSLSFELLSTALSKQSMNGNQSVGSPLNLFMSSFGNLMWTSSDGPKFGVMEFELPLEFPDRLDPATEVIPRDSLSLESILTVAHVI